MLKTGPEGQQFFIIQESFSFLLFAFLMSTYQVISCIHSRLFLSILRLVAPSDFTFTLSSLCLFCHVYCCNFFFPMHCDDWSRDNSISTYVVFSRHAYVRAVDCHASVWPIVTTRLNWFRQPFRLSSLTRFKKVTVNCFIRKLLVFVTY